MPDPSLVEPIQATSAALLALVSVGLLVTAVGRVVGLVASRFRIASRVWIRVRNNDTIGELESIRPGLRPRSDGAIYGTLSGRAGPKGGTALYRATAIASALLLTLSVLGIGHRFVADPVYYGAVAGGLLVTIGLRDRVRTAAAGAASHRGWSIR